MYGSLQSTPLKSRMEDTLHQVFIDGNATKAKNAKEEHKACTTLVTVKRKVEYNTYEISKESEVEGGSKGYNLPFGIAPSSYCSG